MNKKFAVVTGPSTGIGKAIAVELAKNDNFIALVGRSKDKLLATKRAIEDAGGEAEVFICDLAQINSVKSLIKSVKEKTNHVDILVNVAGIWHGKDEVYAGKDFESFAEEVIIDTFSVGLI